MTVETTSVFAGPYPTDGIATAFPFAFKALSPREVRVEIDGDVISASLYGVQIAAQSGVIVFLSAPNSGGTLYVLSDPDFRQGISFSNQSAFLPTSHNEANDRAAVRDLLLRNRMDRSFAVPVGETAGTLPALAGRVGKVAVFGADGGLVAIDSLGVGNPDVQDDGLWNFSAGIIDDGMWG